MPTYTLNNEREEFLENYLAFQAKKYNSYEKVLFATNENPNKFPEDDPQIRNEKTEYISNILNKHRTEMPWELLKSKFIVRKNPHSSKKIPLEMSNEQKNSKSGKEEVKNDENKKNQKNDEKNEVLSNQKFVESSMEEDSVRLFNIYFF